jgi:lipopolysaccharide/colanic/teichoic acid biosynthesis glycosyltransferase
MMAKRLFDLCGAVLGLLMSLPLLLVVAMAVKLDSAGPVLFTPVRVGRGGRPFRVFKFRSMFVDSDKGSAITKGVDPRVTRIGSLIRPLRIDELPQLLNVLIGNMSLVGPRPEAPSIVERYTAEQRRVLEVRPGITGPTQLESLDEAARLPADAEATEYYVRHLLPDKLASDLHYVKTRTFAGDIRTLLKTPVCLGHFLLVRLHFSRLLKITGRRAA